MSDDDLLFEESLIGPAGRYPTLPSAFRDRVVQAAVRASQERTRRRRIWLAGCGLMLLSLAGGQVLVNIATARRNESLAARSGSATSVREDKSTEQERMAVLGTSEWYLMQVRERLRKRREIFLGIF